MTDEEKIGFERLFAAIGVAKLSVAFTGQMDCPKCGKELRWARAASNNHTRGACATDSCVSWIE